MAQSAKKRQVRGGIVLRVDLSPEEHKELKILAIEKGSTVPKIVAEQVRAILARSGRKGT
jgi:hypothetical protein